MKFEYRSLGELNADGSKLVGYAVKWDSLSHDLGGFVEKVQKGAFTRTLKETPDVRALVGHDADKVLGRTKAGTLSLIEDNVGLRVEIIPPDTTWGRDIVTLVERGDVNNMSFAFAPYPDGSHFDTSTTPVVRTLSSVRLREVSIVTWPAYEASSISLRDLLSLPNADLAQRRMRLALASRT